jgi:Rho-related BTB domain-containing protein 1/2
MTLSGLFNCRRVKEGDIVLPEEGRAVARKVGASYYETSVLAQYGITDVFNNAVRACLFHKRRAQIFSKIGNLKHVTKPHLQVGPLAQAVL